MATSPTTTTSRLLVATPFLLAAALMCRATSFTMVPALGDHIALTHQTGVFSLDGVEFPIRVSFYGIGAVDRSVATLTSAFAYLQMYPVDPIAYWHSFVFLSQFSGLYAVVLAESCRPSNRGTLFQFPVAMLLPSQFIPVGIMGPILFLIYTFKSAMPGSSRPGAISPAHAAAILPTVLVAYGVPHVLGYLHPSYEARHWWNWLWQLYPIWGSFVFFLTSTALSPVLGKSNGELSRRITRFAFVALAVGGTASYWYTLWQSGLSLTDIFIPRYLIEMPGDAKGTIRNLIQYDYICSFTALMLWLAFALGRLKASGKLGLSWLSLSGLAIVVSGGFGVGPMLLGAYILRDALMDEEVSGEKEE